MAKIIISMALSVFSRRFIVSSRVALFSPRVSLFFQSNKRACRSFIRTALSVAHIAEYVVNEWIYHEYTAALHTLIESGQLEEVRTALSFGANVNYLNKEGFAPLHSAIKYGSVEIVQLLIDYGAVTNISDEKGNTPLHEAASRSLTLVDILIQSGADDCVYNRDNETPLEWATKEGRIEIVERLIQARRHSKQNEWKRSVRRSLAIAINIGREDILHLFLERGAELNVTQIHDRFWMYMEPFLNQAIRLGRLDCVRLLIQYGADVNEVDRRFHFCSHSLALNCHTPLELAIQKKDLISSKYWSKMEQNLLVRLRGDSKKITKITLNN